MLYNTKNIISENVCATPVPFIYLPQKMRIYFRDESQIKKAIGKNEFLNNVLEGQRLQDVTDAMYSKDVRAREIIIKEGETGSHMYVSATGSYEVLVKGQVVNSFTHTHAFGELAILYNAKRNATIRAAMDGKVWVLDRFAYQEIMIRSNIIEQNEMVTFLKQVPSLNKKDDNTLQQVANLLQKEFFNTDEVIVRQGDRGDKFYIIRAGTVTVTKDNEGVVGTLHKGQFFGELALLKEDCRQATVSANAPGVECLTLARLQFITHFGDIPDLDLLPTKGKSKVEVVKHGDFSDIELKDLKIIKTLGVGGFGRVELVQHTKKANLTFALKYLKKVDMVEQQQQEHAFNEKDLQMSCNTHFIVRLYKTFRDNKYLYFLMESCLGGDLWTLLHKQRNRCFKEQDARFFAACVLEAFAYLHERGIIYRDLKPENLLIDHQGYLKLTDFGFAKKLGPRGKTFTFAGTPEYVAPEIVLNRGHDKAVDYWAFGIFIFELLVGRTPFRTNDPSHMKTYNLILRGIDNIYFDSRTLAPTVTHLIKKLCRTAPTERIGCLKDGAQDVRSHRWFKGFDWDKLNAKKMPSPFVPKLKSNIDTSCFDNFSKDTDIPPDDLTGWDKNF